MNVYVLDFSFDYKSFDIITDPSPLEFLSDFWFKYREVGRSVAKEWQEIEIEFAEDDYDYDDEKRTVIPEIEGDIMRCSWLDSPVLSQRAYELLREVIGPSVEFYPLKSNEGNYWTFKVLSFFDASVLDLTRSKLEWKPMNKKAVQEGKRRMFRRSRLYGKYVDHFFLEDRIAGTPIFLLLEHGPDTIFVTDSVADCIEKNKLTGTDLCQVYPIEDQEEIRRQAYEKAMRRRKR